MPFDDLTRNELQKVVGKARDLLVEEFTSQCQRIYGIQPSGFTMDLSKLEHLPQEELVGASLLRDRIDNLAAGITGAEARSEAVARMVREQGFTVLNRLCALRMCEERGLVQECVRSGYESKGFKLYDQTASRLGGDTYGRYALFLQLLFDELSVDLGVLFDRFALTGLLFPGENALKQVLVLIDSSKLSHIWAEDEAIGWVYQYFNSPEERKTMRDASPAPRNSRELAVRNQFFTPRYVVEFLTDNTLGRIWYEMRKGDTALKHDCRYLVRQSTEIFLEAGGPAPAEKDDADLSQDKLPRKRAYIAHRAKKDPRDLRVLDPACGSGHFLLYAFDLFERIYEEAWTDLESSEPEVATRALRVEFETMDDLRRAVPKLIIEHNLHGIDIDPRAAQIAALALWLRAQKSWKSGSLKAAERPRIERSNIVTAEPMPGDDEMRRDFTAGLRPRVLGQLMDVVFKEMKLAGEAGSLLKIEEEIKNAIAEAKRQWLEAPEPEQQLLFPGIRTPRPQQQAFRFDLSGVTDEGFWHQAEERTLTALKEYAAIAENGHSITRRLFADDASRGFAFIDLCGRRYDVVLMNPPFGDASLPSKPYLDETYGDTRGDVYKAFVECFQARLEPAAMLGIISSRTGFFLGQSEDWRTRIVLRLFRPLVLADLGTGVLDAMVEVAAYVLRNLSRQETRDLTLSLVPALGKVPLDRQERFSLPKWQVTRNGLKRHQAVAELERLEAAGFVKRCTGDVVRYTPVWLALKAVVPPPEPVFPPLVSIQLLTEKDKGGALVSAIHNPHDRRNFVADPRGFFSLPSAAFAYWATPTIRAVFERYAKLGDTHTVASGTGTLDDFRFLRLWHEVPTIESAGVWFPYAKGGSYSRFYFDQHLSVNWRNDGSEMKAWIVVRYGGGHWARNIRSTELYFRPGLTWPRRSQKGLSVRPLARGSVFGDKGPAVFCAEDDPPHLLALLALMNSSTFRMLVSLQMAFGSYEVGVFQRTAIPPFDSDSVNTLSGLAKQAWSEKHALDTVQSASHAFVLPALFAVPGTTLAERAIAWNTRVRACAESVDAIQSQIDDVTFRLYCLDAADRAALSVTSAAEAASNVTSETEDQEEEQDSEIISADASALVADLIDYAVGIAFGRWDIRIALDGKLVPKPPDPFDPPPVCPLGALVGPDGLPAERRRIVSDQWLRTRTLESALRPEKTVEGMAISETEYPFRVSWNGLLVDDPGFNGSLPHREDIVRRFREVLALLWNDKAQDIETEVCELLAVSSVRDYFQKPNGFFQDHLKHYSKSRRKAPIYWPLSTESGTYTVWLYYPRISDQTLYACVNDYLDPKLRDVEKDLERLRALANPDRRSQRNLDELGELRLELKSMRERLLKIASLPYKPDQNDGVLLSAAPLWQFFRYGPWRTTLRNCWEELNQGKYEWASLAYAMWPERVRKACKKDKSIAIAHGFKDL